MTAGLTRPTTPGSGGYGRFSRVFPEPVPAYETPTIGSRSAPGADSGTVGLIGGTGEIRS
jgi:hypothetical protein